MNRKLLLSFASLLGIQYGQSQTIDSTAKISDSAHVFQLGEVTVTAPMHDAFAHTMDAKKMSLYNRNTVAQAIAMLPGISLSNTGARNESMVYLRGFDLRSTPVMIDGIPVYVPYDGYVDLARFVTFDLSKIEVSKDYVSVNYGPNAMGGAINLITRKPVNKFELNGVSGWQTGGYKSTWNVGSNLGKFYVQAGLSKFKQDYLPLSKKFTPNNHQGAGHRNNSYSDDEKVNVKVAYRPNAKSEYALSYIYQHGTKGSPLYAGYDTLNSLYAKSRYWQWPKWDKRSLYFLSHTQIDPSQYIQTRLYYDKFINTLNSYDDDSYSTMKKPYAFSSLYNDYTLGGIIQYGKNWKNIDYLTSSVQYKADIHREHDVGEPVRKMSDGTFTAAVENHLNITKSWSLLTGFSFNNRSSLTAQDYNSNTNTITNYPTNHNNAVNAQAALQYQLDENNQLRFAVSRKTRFATTKDRYSYRMGTAIPNPNLKAEYDWSYNLSYTGHFVENKLKVYASAYLYNVENTILTVSNVSYDSTTKMYLSQMQNVGKTRNEGFEASVDYQIAPALLVGSNYTFINLKNITQPSVYLINVPKSKWIGYAQYAYKDYFTVQVNGEYDSKRYSTSYGTAVGGYAVMNGSIRAHVWKYFSVEGGVNNIFDRNYALVEGYPEAGRNFYANLIYRL